MSGRGETRYIRKMPLARRTFNKIRCNIRGCKFRRRFLGALLKRRLKRIQRRLSLMTCFLNEPRSLERDSSSLRLYLSRGKHLFPRQLFKSYSGRAVRLRAVFSSRRVFLSPRSTILPSSICLDIFSTTLSAKKPALRRDLSLAINHRHRDCLERETPSRVQLRES